MLKVSITALSDGVERQHVLSTDIALCTTRSSTSSSMQSCIGSGVYKHQKITIERRLTLNTFSSKWPWVPLTEIATLLPITCRRTAATKLNIVNLCSYFVHQPLSTCYLPKCTSNQRSVAQTFDGSSTLFYSSYTSTHSLTHCTRYERALLH
jgi:hypothetical protein